MKRCSKLISIALSVMLLVTMSSVGVFAAEDMNAPEAPQVTDDAALQDAEPEVPTMSEDMLGEGETEATDPAEEPAAGLAIGTIDDQFYTGEQIKPEVSVTYNGDPLTADQYELSYGQNIYVNDPTATVTVTYNGETATANFKIKAPEKPAAVTGLKAVRGCERIKLKWDPVEGADTYRVLRSDMKKTKGWPRDLKALNLMKKESGKQYWENYKNINIYKKYTYTVYAAKNYKEYNAKSKTGYTAKQVISTGKTVKAKCVSKLRIVVKSKQSVTLKSVKGHKKYRVKKGKKITTEGYGGGKYYFYKKIGKKNYKFRIMNVRVKAKKAKYDTKTEYSNEEAEYFINKHSYTKPSSTSKSRLIWASTYTQQVFVFEKKGGKWEVEKNWDCSSGNKSAPSPTGNFKIHKRITNRHHIKYWSCFSTLNALHGIKPVRYAGYDWNKHLGHIMSNGCIRNANDDATWLWNHCGKGTKCLVY